MTQHLWWKFFLCLITNIEPRESINCERYLTGCECNIEMHSRKEWKGKKNCQWEKKSREAWGEEGEEGYVKDGGGGGWGGVEVIAVSALTQSCIRFG